MKYPAIFCFLFLYQSAFSQTAAGQITDPSLKPVSDVMVYILSPDSSRILAMTVTDSNGIWNIKLPQNEVVVKFEALGFNEVFAEISLFLNPEMVHRLILQLSQQVLPEVEIKERRIALVLSGDTLTYDVKAYSKSGDRTLRDVLTSMPGVSVDHEGQIYYNNRKIDKLLLEGKDILQNQHRLTGESFLIEDVAKIQVIEQYKSFRDILSGRYSDLIAMNIVLKEEAKNTLKGDATLLAGYKDRAVLKTNQFFAGKKTSGNTFIRSDNTGQPAFTAMDFLGLQSSLARSLTQAGGDIDALLPESFVKPQDILKNRESVVSSAWNHEPNKYVATQFSVTGYYASRELGHFFSKNYFLSLNNITGNTQGDQKTPVIYAVLNNRLTLSKNLHLEIEVPMEWGNIREGSKLSGTLDRRLFSNHLSSKISHYSIFPQYYLLGTLKGKWNYQISQNYFYKRNSGELTIQDSFGIFIENVTGLEQQNIRTSRHFNSSFLLEKEFKKHRFGFFYHFKNPEEIFNISRNPVLRGIEEGRQSITDIIHEPGLSYEFKTNVWWMTLSGSARNIHRNDEWAGRTDKTFVGLTAKLRFNFSRFHYILVRGKLDKNLPGQTTVRKTEEITDGQTIQSGGTSSIMGVTSKTASLLYVFLMPGGKKRYQLQFEYSDIIDPVLAGSVYEQQYILMLYFRAKRSFMFLSQNSFDYTFNKHWVMNVKAMYTGQNQMIDESRNFETQNIGLSFLISSKYKKMANIELLLKSNQQSFRNELVNYGFRTLEGSGKLIFQKNKIRMVHEFSWNQQFSKNFDVRNRFLKLHYIWEFTLKNQWTLMCQGIDITNIQPMTISEGLFNDQFVGFKTFNRFPGSILVGVRKSL